MKEVIVYGALLHDIGKLIYRGLKENELKHGYRHQELGAQWAEMTGLSEDIVTVIKRHHSLKKSDVKYSDLSVDSFTGKNSLHNVLKAVDVADNLSAGMERSDFDTKHGVFRLSGLKSIFSSVSLESKKKDGSYYIWEPKSFKDMPYPEELEGNSAEYAAFYAKEWESFRDEFEKIKNNIHEETLLVLLQKYTMMIPEHTLVTEYGPPDTSLYHHLKSTAAVAWCIYRYLVDEMALDWEKDDLSKDIYKTSDDKYLLVAGDFSGIQKFIYTITSKAALKTVRARSFYLELLAECAVSQLVEELNLCRSCIVYNSGGGFYLLAPNTTMVKEKLDSFAREFNNYLLKKFGFTLYLSMAYRPLSGDDLKGRKDGRETLGAVWSDLKRDLGREKGRKWLDMMEDEFEKIFEPAVEQEKCAACHQPLDKKEPVVFPDGDELKLCRFCSDMVKLGERLPELQCFYEVNQKVKGSLCIEIFGCYYVFSKPEKNNEIKCKYLVKKLWQTSEDKSSYPIKNFPAGSYFAKKEFIELSKAAVGLKKLGILRMDVDYLGRIFSRGLGEKNTFARLNDLSERMNLYFKYYLPSLFERSKDKSLLGIPREKLMVNLVYAGGDDLFLVGTWDSALDAAALIYSDFKKYTGYNPDITISGGLAIADEKVAFYRLAEAAGAEEKRAKSNERDSFSLLGFPLKWSEVLSLNNDSKEVNFHDLLKVLASGAKYESGRAVPQAFSRSFIQHLLHHISYYIYSLADRDRKDERYWVFPQVHYLMARAMRSSMGRKYKDSFYRPLFSMMLNEKVLEKQMIPALQVVDYLTRKGSE